MAVMVASCTGIDDGAHVDAFVQRVAKAQPVHPAFQLVVEAVGDAFLHQKAATRRSRPGPD